MRVKWNTYPEILKKYAQLKCKLSPLILVILYNINQHQNYKSIKVQKIDFIPGV